MNRYDMKLLRDQPDEIRPSGPRKDGLRLVKNPGNFRLFILGKPGAGKTTFLKYVAIRAAKGDLDRIPIFVSLREWADSELNLMDYLVAQFEICAFPEPRAFVEHILLKGHALVLFDGLDEVSKEGRQRARLITEVRNFSNRYSLSQCLITCRIAATEYAFERFTYVELADFTDAQAKAFVRKWFKGAPRKRKLFEEAFHRAENRGLREIARIPLLLSLLCLSFDATLEFPSRRVEIYEEAVEALLKKWDTSRSIKRDPIYQDLSLGRKRQMFARIAAQTFQEGKYFLSQNALSKHIVRYLRQLPGSPEEEEIDGDSVLKAIEEQHGIFTERAHRIYSFAHLTFQEYFTARQVVADTTGRALRGLLSIQNLTNDRWREVILLTVSLLDNADDCFENFLSSLSKLAAKDPLVEGLLDWVSQRADANSLAGPALRSYHCYQIFSFLVAPSFSSPKHSSSSTLMAPSLTFSSTYSSSHLIDIPFAIATRLDRSRALNEAIIAETKENLETARREVLSQKLELEPIPPAFEIDNELAIHLSHAFFCMLTILNLRDILDTRHLVASLRSYFIGIRKFCNEFNAGDLTSEIRAVAIPNDVAAEQAWISAMEKIRDIVRGLSGSKLELTSDQQKNVLTYFIACRLLIDCLSLAVVSDRATIESRMLLAPTREKAA